MAAPTATPTVVPTGMATPTPVLTARATPTATPVPAPLILDFKPIIASEAAWDCVAGHDWPTSFDRERDPGNLILRDVDGYTTRCGWHEAFRSQAKRPEAVYYQLYVHPDAVDVGEWDRDRRSAFEEVTKEVSFLTGLRFAPYVSGEHDLDDRLLLRLDDTLTLIAACDSPEHGIASCGKYGLYGFLERERGRPGYPVRPSVGIDVTRVTGGREFRHVLRHELLHVLFGFYHAYQGPSVLTESYMPGEEPDGFTLQDEEMLGLYGAIPAGMPWEEIQGRACVGVGDQCYRLYEWFEEPWWEWDQ
ncbi:MAG: hypothetical protein OXO53_08625 [Chloroflexota bacterium]|nr:hypothetical protein [Chloroflexota bacterium]